MKINDKLIVQFRKEINGNSGFVFFYYHNKNGKNLWHIICSCMDWISISVRFLSKKTRFSKDIDVRVMQLYSIISAIDIIFESICQLHRVIFDTDSLPYKGEYNLFKKNALNLDDNEYFKELRAMFGAHPVNLKHKNKKKWFASWPHEPFINNNSLFEIRLYSNEIGQDDLTFGIDIDEIEYFANERYGYLLILIKEIESQYVQFCNKLASIKISIGQSTIDTLHILKRESIKRLNTDYYSDCIAELIKVFTISIDDDKYKKEIDVYRNRLLPLIRELFLNLQNMEFKELVNKKILNPDYPYDKIGYSISKLYTYDFSSSKEPLYNYHMKELDKFSNERYEFVNTNDPDILFFKIKLMLYANMANKG